VRQVHRIMNKIIILSGMFDTIYHLINL